LFSLTTKFVFHLGADALNPQDLQLKKPSGFGSLQC